MMTGECTQCDMDVYVVLGLDDMCIERPGDFRQICIDTMAEEVYYHA